MGGCLSSSADSGSTTGYYHSDTPRVRTGGVVLDPTAQGPPKISAAEASRNAALARLGSRPVDAAAGERALKDALVAKLSERYRRAGKEVPMGLPALPLAKLRVLVDNEALP